MKVAILGEGRHGFIKPMSLGLQQMLQRLGVGATFFDRGLAMLDYRPGQEIKIAGRNWLKKSINFVKPRSYELQHNVYWWEVNHFEQQLMAFDLIVVVSPLPTAFLADRLSRIELLRQRCKIPIVLYQNYYLPTRGDWATRLTNRDNYPNGSFGLERYHWYLAASMVSEQPLTKKEHPCSLIGHDLRADNLHPNDKTDFKVLLDFNHPGFEAYRQLQITALQQTNTPYTELKGRYSQDEIRQLYRQHSALFLATRESFGLPIVENQLCGSLIFAAHKNWAPSHYIGKSLYDSGVGELGDNFVIYDNDLVTLKAKLSHYKIAYQPSQVLARFQQQYPHLYNGDLTALSSMLDKVQSGFSAAAK